MNVGATSHFRLLELKDTMQEFMGMSENLGVFQFFDVKPIIAHMTLGYRDACIPSPHLLIRTLVCLCYCHLAKHLGIGISTASC
jgi:hypothetical protein